LNEAARPPAAPEPVVTRTMWLLGAAAVLLVAIAAPFDVAAADWARAADSPVTRLMIAITDIGRNIWYLTPAAVIFVFALTAARTRSDRRERRVLKAVAGHAFFAFAAIGLAALVTAILKRLIGRARPALMDEGGAFAFNPLAWNDLYYSFPSGHSTTIGAVAAVLAMWFPRAAVPLLAVGVFLAATRVPAQAHYPSDVVAGFSLGFLFAIAAGRFLARRGIALRQGQGRLLPSPAGPRPEG
jgi:membrane-associated phospholipid phosphatase